MSNFSPILINTLGQFFLRKGRPISRDQIEDNSITPEKLSVSILSQEDLAPLEQGLSQVSQGLTALEQETGEEAASQAEQIQALQETVDALQVAFTALELRVSNIEATMEVGVATEEIRVVDEDAPANRIILTIGGGIVTDVTREVI